MGHKVLTQALTFHFLRSMKNKTFLSSRPAVKYLLSGGPGSGWAVQPGVMGQRPAYRPASSSPLGPSLLGPHPSAPASAILSSAILSSAGVPTPHLHRPLAPTQVPTHTSQSGWFQPPGLWSTRNESQMGFHPGGPRFANQRRSFSAPFPLICLRPPRLQAA